MGVIYKLTSPTKKCYIGQSITNLDDRIKTHLKASSGCRAIKAALDKYGVESFVCETLLEVTNDLLDHYEKLFINLYDSYGPHGYNLTPAYLPKYLEYSNAFVGYQ